MHCPICGHTKFWAGPEGGASQDILCQQCGTEFCYCAMVGDFDNLGRDEKRAKEVYGVSPLPSYDCKGALNVLNREKLGLFARCEKLGLFARLKVKLGW